MKTNSRTDRVNYRTRIQGTNRTGKYYNRYTTNRSINCRFKEGYTFDP